jgi:tripartite-type tricarboxylate transporter receptor subunit TctC
MKGRLLMFTVVAMMFALCQGIYPAAALDYPTRPITLIDPYPAGGTLDLQARAFAIVAEKVLGQPFVTVNRAGATGLIGSQEGAKAAPDGYTLTVGATFSTCTIAWELVNGRKPAVNKDDFVLIGSFTLSPTLVIVPYDSPWKTLADLVKDCKAKPNHYTFGSGGLYGMSHVPGEILGKAAGFTFRHVPYKGGGPVMSAVVGGHLDFATQYPPGSIPLHRGNKLRILAVQSNKRLKAIPEIPTVKELGIDAEFYAWVGIMAPKGTPAPIVEKLRDAAAKAAKDESFAKALGDDEVYFMNAQELQKYWDYELETFSSLYRELMKQQGK